MPRKTRSSNIEKGNLVEFTRVPKQSYTMGDGEYGVAIEDERPNRTVMVELADGSRYLARYIHAYAWAGWFPEELEPVFEKYNRDLIDRFEDELEDEGGF